MKRENRGTIKGMQMLCKMWPLIGSKAAHAKQKHHKKPREIHGSFSILKNVPRIYTLTIHWNLDKLVKINKGTIVRQLLIGLRHMELQKEQCLFDKRA